MHDELAGRFCPLQRNDKPGDREEQDHPDSPIGKMRNDQADAEQRIVVGDEGGVLDDNQRRRNGAQGVGIRREIVEHHDRLALAPDMLDADLHRAQYRT